jgi:hypothetical protein
MGFTAAAVPIVSQLLMLGAVYTTPGAFPKADKGFIEAKFWPIQIVLLCLAVTGNAIVDFAKLVVDRNAGAVEVVVQFLLMVFSFLFISVLFSITLLNTEPAWTFTIAMTISGAIGLVMAYRVETDIALIEAGVR